MIFAPALLAVLPAAAPVEPLQRGGSVQAPPPAMRWTFAEAFIARRDFDAAGDDVTGYGARGAFELGDGLFLHGAAQVSGDSYLDGAFDLTRFDLGIGHHVLLQRDVDAFAKLSWVHYDIDDLGDADGSEDGWRAELGVRGMMDDKIELEARIGWEDVIDSGFVWGLDGRWWVWDRFAVGLGFEQEDQDEVYNIALRYVF